MKRIFDVVSSCLVLVNLSSLLLIISIAIKMDSKGNIIYKQQRVGRNNKNFNLLKFRTMRVGADQTGLITVGDRDPRITRIGYFLRKYKIDELPQLINVIKGEMSIVGPRPEVRKYVDLYSEEEQRVLSVRPGLTDYASIEYIDENALLAKSDDSEKAYIEEVMPAKLQLNLKYIDNQSFIEDMRLIFGTIKKIIGN
jgi:lipopolysaccharide/colanic/teichoic acid biosynthesis glycosyltransferase